VGINTPEIGEEGYEEAKAFVNTTCWGEEVTLNVDDMRQYDPYYRILAVVYVNDTNLNEKLVTLVSGWRIIHLRRVQRQLLHRY
jgi:micrococcal nuclease